ncbi:peptidyl-prolyl cis-trans isomerase B (cyclophilin B) [Klenkia soli]|uniref:Peptidyl-prolyl cis-trans isomerase B (Cyclophilin B) n=1 Tax=Klenkia soli TaxID=1052260 RepID=A0A1H0LWM8_9ACTN|nr:peptidylprolyl isomerase [Klenkia soli]SDO72386.1 peptidyl-prolyl cis-trans isomerase B (cyclophilin B) [Klenkia soli]
MRRRAAGAVVLAGLVLAGCTSTITGTASPADPTSGPAPTATTSAGPCTYTEDPRGSAGDVVPDAPSGPPPTGTVRETVATGAGDIGLELRTSGPGTCATASFVSLAAQGYFDDTPCHRLTTSPGLQVLQCGDPSGTGAGGPGYTFPTDVDGTETYGRGVLAMANSGQGFDGSQFFLVYGDSQLTPDYTVFGTVDEAGLGVVDQIAAAGVADGSQDGAPAVPVTITAVTPTT